MWQCVLYLRVLELVIVSQNYVEAYCIFQAQQYNKMYKQSVSLIAFTISVFDDFLQQNIIPLHQLQQKYRQNLKNTITNPKKMSHSLPISNMDNLSRLRQQYQAIYQQNSSFRQSLLVSPYCSKFQREKQKQKQPQESPNPSLLRNANPLLTGSGFDNSLLDYIRPFESQQLNKTESKSQNRGRRRLMGDVDGRKRTEPDYEYEDGGKIGSEGKFVEELREIIRERDERIEVLERNLAELGFNKHGDNNYNSNKKSTQKQHNTQATISGSPQTKAYYRLNIPQSRPQQHQQQDKKSDKSISQYSKQTIFHYETQIANYKKQLKFLTFNNQQLYEQLTKINDYCEKLKKNYANMLFYSQDLEEKVVDLMRKNQELEEMNGILIGEKEEMMGNYKEELELFHKMKKIWQQQNAKIGKTGKALIESESKTISKNRSNEVSRKENQQRGEMKRSKSTRYKVYHLGEQNA